LPRPGVSDAIFGFSRSFYYTGETRGWWRLIRIRAQGKERGVTLVPFKAVEAFVRAQAEAQGEAEVEKEAVEKARLASKV
jgi:hypothetical protein